MSDAVDAFTFVVAAFVRRLRTLGGVATISVLASASCKETVYRADFKAPQQAGELKFSDQYLKCHMKDGGVYVLDSWGINPQERLVMGSGLLYDSERRLVTTGTFRIPLDAVALFETNDPESVTRGGVVVMAVVTGASLAMTGLCL